MLPAGPSRAPWSKADLPASYIIWRKKMKVPDGVPVFCMGGSGSHTSGIRSGLLARGWYENTDGSSPFFDVKWTISPTELDYHEMWPEQVVNHFQQSVCLTTKVGLCRTIRDLAWFESADYQTFYPRAYDLRNDDDRIAWLEDVHHCAAEAIVKRAVLEGGLACTDTSAARSRACGSHTACGPLSSHQYHIQLETLRAALKVCMARLRKASASRSEISVASVQDLSCNRTETAASQQLPSTYTRTSSVRSTGSASAALVARSVEPAGFTVSQWNNLVKHSSLKASPPDTARPACSEDWMHRSFKTTLIIPKVPKSPRRGKKSGGVVDTAASADNKDSESQEPTTNRSCDDKKTGCEIMSPQPCQDTEPCDDDNVKPTCVDTWGTDSSRAGSSSSSSSSSTRCDVHPAVSFDNMATSGMDIATCKDCENASSVPSSTNSKLESYNSNLHSNHFTSSVGASPECNGLRTGDSDLSHTCTQHDDLEHLQQACPEVPRVTDDQISSMDAMSAIALGQDVIAALASFHVQTHINGMNNIWICKPAGKSRGRGIRLFNDPDKLLAYVSGDDAQSLESHWVVQKYIERPLIIHQRKFDIRQWVLVTSWSPLVVWFWDTCYLRFAADDYSAADLDVYSHLSNNSIAKYFTGAKDDDITAQGNMWSVDQYKDWLGQQYGRPELWEQLIQPAMQHIVVCTTRCAQDTVHHRANTFQLYGYDFLIDDELRVWLLEVNSSPTMEASTPITSELCAGVQEDILKVVVDLPCAGVASVGSGVNSGGHDTGRWRCIVDTAHEIKAPPYIGLNLELKGTAIAKPAAVKRQATSPSKLPSVALRASMNHRRTDSSGDCSETPINVTSSRHTRSHAQLATLRKTISLDTKPLSVSSGGATSAAKNDERNGRDKQIGDTGGDSRTSSPLVRRQLRQSISLPSTSAAVPLTSPRAPPSTHSVVMQRTLSLLGSPSQTNRTQEVAQDPAGADSRPRRTSSPQRFSNVHSKRLAQNAACCSALPIGPRNSHVNERVVNEGGQIRMHSSHDPVGLSHNNTPTSQHHCPISAKLMPSLSTDATVYSQCDKNPASTSVPVTVPVLGARQKIAAGSEKCSHNVNNNATDTRFRRDSEIVSHRESVTGTTSEHHNLTVITGPTAAPLPAVCLMVNRLATQTLPARQDGALDSCARAAATATELESKFKLDSTTHTSSDISTHKPDIAAHPVPGLDIETAADAKRGVSTINYTPFQHDMSRMLLTSAQFRLSNSFPSRGNVPPRASVNVKAQESPSSNSTINTTPQMNRVDQGLYSMGNCNTHLLASFSNAMSIAQPMLQQQQNMSRTSDAVRSSQQVMPSSQALISPLTSSVRRGTRRRTDTEHDVFTDGYDEHRMHSTMLSAKGPTLGGLWDTSDPTRPLAPSRQLPLTAMRNLKV